jgi:DNA helicase-2/ATP-dependent DNA helicase PcrA
MTALHRFVRTIEKFQQLYVQSGPGKLKEVAEELLREAGVQDDLVRAGPTMKQAEWRLRNLTEFLGSMQRYAEKAGADFDMLAYLNRLSISSQEEDVDDSLQDQVTLSTLHGAKGLEWKVVFFVGLEEEILPHKRSLAPREADHTIAGRRPAEGSDPGEDTPASDLSEERRLCYVGITRARSQLYLSRSELRGGWPKHPSRFLDDIPAELLTCRDLDGPPPKKDPQDEAAFVKALIAQSLSVSE